MASAEDRQANGRPAPAGEAAALAFALLFPTLGIWLYFVAASAPAWTRLLYLASKAVQFSFPLAWTRLADGGPRRSEPAARARPGDRGQRRPAGRGVGLGLAMGLAAAGGLLLGHRFLLAGNPLLAGLPAGIAARLAAIGIDTAGGFLAVAAFYSVIHSLLEEYYWRWFVFGRLRRRLGFPAAAALSSLAFAAHHVVLLGLLLGSFGPLTWLFSLAVAAGGAAWAWLYEKSGTLAGPWLSHALVDAALMTIGYRLWAAG
jgi:uncharacterized protein